MMRSRRLGIAIIAVAGMVLCHPALASDTAPADNGQQATSVAVASNPEMKAIFDADQADRKSPSVDWNAVGLADEKRRMRTRELLAQNLLHTGQDYEEAAYVFQHGNTADSYLLAHILAMVAVAKGNRGAIWIATATLDRYLMKIGQKQVLGTQYGRPDSGGPWTQEPYDRDLVSDALRLQLGVGTQASQAEYLRQLQSRS